MFQCSRSMAYELVRRMGAIELVKGGRAKRVPARNVEIYVQQRNEESWQTICTYENGPGGAEFETVTGSSSGARRTVATRKPRESPDARSSAKQRIRPIT